MPTDVTLPGTRQMIRIENIREYAVVPEHAIPGDGELRHFSVFVKYRGEYQGKKGGGWSVTSGLGEELSRSMSWQSYPDRFRRWQYRWETFAEALESAHSVVEDVGIFKRNWSQWHQWIFDQMKVELAQKGETSVSAHIDRLLSAKNLPRESLLAKMDEISTDPAVNTTEVFDDIVPLSASLADLLEKITRISAREWLEIDHDHTTR